MRFFSTMQAGRLCRLSRQTIARRYDEGYLKGYKTPTKEDRRIRMDSLLRFMIEQGIPLNDFDDDLEAQELILLIETHRLEDIKKNSPSNKSEIAERALLIRLIKIKINSMQAVS